MEEEDVKVNSKYTGTNIYTHFENPFEDWDSTQEKDSERVNRSNFLR